MRKIKLYVILRGIQKMNMEKSNFDKNENINEIESNSSIKDIKQIKNISVEELYRICDISKSMPISFDHLLKHFKIRIMGTDFSFISKFKNVKEKLNDQGTILGMVNIENGFANIYYNNNPEIDIPRQRFTIAHELAHCINHYDILSKKGQVEFKKDEDKYENLETIDKDEQNEYLSEFVCNKFARDFLIPSDMLINIINIMGKVSVTDLAELFMVPKKEMKIKLKELGY